MAQTPFEVVLVDDAQDVRSLVHTQLRLSGDFIVVGEGSTGREAVQLASHHQPALLVLDASMPDMDGLTALPGILAASPNTKVVLFSGFDATSLRDVALARGASDYIEKSTPIRELPARLLAVLNAAASDWPLTPDPAFEAKVEEVLATHLERFRTVFEQAAIGMATLTLSGTIVRANQALAEALGRSEAELVGQPLTSIAPEDFRDELWRAVNRASAEIGAAEIEHRLMTDAGIRWAHTTVAAVRDLDDKALYLFAQLEDVTARHHALEQLRASEERFRLMVESVRDYAIFMLDTDGFVSTWNAGAERLKGYTASEVIGRHFRTFYPEEQQQAEHPEFELREAVAHGRYEEEGWRVRKDGTTFWALVVITALYDDEGRHFGFAKVTRDMTERREALEKLRGAAQQTEEFLAVIAHELQSPIAAITGAADILEDYWDTLEPVDRLETLNRITSGGRRIRLLLHDLLTASRIEAGTFAVSLDETDLASVIANAISELAATDQVIVRGAEGLVVRADPIRVAQIITNLLTNAFKYGQAPFVLAATRCDDAIEIRVSDAGAGPPEGVQSALFGKFAKGSSPQVRGTGLGLFIVRELARSQGGDAWFEPTSTFAFRLPAWG
jgi:PAS domain S-box-containing protein